MKKIIAFSLSLFLIYSANAQNPFQTKVSDLHIPDVPGLVLSDKAPSSVDKPANPRAFGVSLLNLREGGAIEVTPFWLANQPHYTFERWLNNKFPLLETFNLSAATFKTDTSSILTAGFRSQLLRIFSNSTKKEVAAKKAEIVTLITPDINPETDEVNNISENDSLDALKKLEELNELKKRGYFALEVAAAIIGASPNNSFKNLASQRSGIWVNFVFSPSLLPINIVGVTRYSWANNNILKTGKDSSFFDYGISLSYDRQKFNLSAESVVRRDISINKNYNRFAFVVNYVLSENIIMVGSFGKNFKKEDNMITVLGIKLGVSRSKLSL